MTKHQFKPDKSTGKRTNKERAGLAYRRLFPFGEDKQMSIDEHVADAIADLGHLCDLRKCDFEEAIKTGVTHWRTER